MSDVKPRLTGLEALSLVKKLKKLVKAKQDERLYGDRVKILELERRHPGEFDRMELHDFVDALEKLEDRLQWSV